MLVVPPPELCTDNGAMIAWAGAERLALGLTDTLDTPPHARWPLSETTGRKPAAAAAARRASRPQAAPAHDLHAHRRRRRGRLGHRARDRRPRAPAAT